MGTVTVSTTPVELDDGSHSRVWIGNTGQVRATVTIGTRTEVFDPGFSRDLLTGGVEVTAVTALGTTTLAVDTTGASPSPGQINEAELAEALLGIGLGEAALLDVGTTSGTVAAGNDARITGAAQTAENLADLDDAGEARTNLGLSAAATAAIGTGAGTVAAGDDARIVDAAPLASPTFTGNVVVPAADAATEAAQYGQLAKHPDGTTVAATVPRPSFLDVRDYGATGDGTTDDTAALQAAITAACNAQTTLLFPTPPGGFYKITAALSVPKSNNWSFVAAGVVELRQFTDDTAILSFAKQSTYRFHIEGLGFRWTNDQPVTNTQAIGIAFGHAADGGESGSGYYNWSARRLRFYNGHKGISQIDVTQNAALWGVELDKVWGFGPMTGPVFCADVLASANGQPNIALRDFYIRMDDCVGPGIIVRSASGVTIENIEFNVSTDDCPTLMEIDTVDGLVVQSWRSEQSTSPALTTTGSGLIVLRGVKGGRLTAINVLNRAFVAGGTPEHSVIYLRDSSVGIDINGVTIRGVDAAAGATFCGVATNGSNNSFTASGIQIVTATGSGTVRELSATAATVHRFVDSTGHTGILTASPQMSLDVKGSLGLLTTVVNNTDHTVAATDHVIIFKGLTTARTLTLPTTTGNTGRRLVVRHATTSGFGRYITITPQAGQTINGASSVTLLVPHAGVELISDGSTTWNAQFLPPPGGPEYVTAAFPADGNYTVGENDAVVLFKTLTASRNVTLPDARSKNGRVIRVADGSGAAGTHNIVIGTSLSQTINGASTYTISTNNGTVELISDSNNWFKLGSS
jgi:hypothetical protein